MEVLQSLYGSLYEKSDQQSLWKSLRKFIYCISKVQELLINVQPHSFWRLGIFQVKVLLTDVFSRVHPYSKVGMRGLDATIQDLSLHDTGADIHGVWWTKRRYDTAITSPTRCFMGSQSLEEVASASTWPWEKISAWRMAAQHICICC